MNQRISFLYRRLTLLAATCCLPVVPLACVQAATPPSAYLFAKVVTSDTPVPDRPGTTFAINNASPAPAIEGNDVVFMETSGLSVIWSVNTATGVFTRLVDTSTAVPGGTSTFNSFNSYQLFNGVVVFSAAGASDPRGLFSVPVTGGAVTKLIDLNTLVPGSTSTLSFDSSDGPYYRVNDGGVLFAASNGVYLVPATSGAVARVSDGTTRTGGGAYNPSFGDESAGLAALTCYDSSVYGRSYLYTAPTSGLTSDGSGNATNATFVAGVGSLIPGFTDGSIFQLGVGGVVRTQQGTVIFTGNGGAADSGIFDSSIRGIYSSVNGVLTKLVDTNTPVPLGAGDFSIPNSGSILPATDALAFRDGQIAFEGMDANGNDGIYAEPSTGGTITKVYAGGDPDPVDGTYSGGFTFGSYGTSQGKVAFLFTLEFSQTSMIVATPKPNITPTAGGDTGIVTITISGKNFAAGASVTLSATGKPTLTAEIVTPDFTGASLAALFDLTGQADGLYDLTITNADGTVLSYPASFTIEPGTDPVLYADVIGRAQARGGYFQSYTILCGNRGNTDAFDVPLEVVVPSYVDLEPGNFTTTPFATTVPGTRGADTFAAPSVHDPDYQRGNVVLGNVPAGQYVAFTVLIKAPSDAQYAHRVFTISALPLRPLLRPDPAGTIKPPGGIGPVFDPEPPVIQDPSTFNPYPDYGPSIYPSIHAPYAYFGDPIFPHIPSLPVDPDPPDYPWPWPTDPLPPTGGSQSPEIIVPGDPNDKIGSLGAGSAHYLSGSGAPLRYTIEFENEPTASASARDISITDQLDPTKVDLSTFALGSLGFGSTVVTPPPGQNQYSTTVDLRPANDLLVQINASLNVSTGLLTYTFTSLDPTTGQPPTDPTAGFLPADIDPPAGEGFVFYTVAPLAGLASGTVITNQASVVFDANAAILTPIWSNTLDVDPPASVLAALPKKEHASAIPLQLTGTDTGGSGVGAYNVYVSDNGGPFTLGLANVPGPTATFNGTTGHTYSFFSQAEDAVLNLETLKTAAEATTKVVGPDLIGAWGSDVATKTTAAGVLKLKGQFTVTNQSPAKPTTAAAVVRFYLSSTRAVDSGATVLGKDAAFDVLAAGASEVVKLTGAKLPAGATSFSGMYVVAVIDPDNAVKETDKTNNAVVFGPLP